MITLYKSTTIIKTVSFFIKSHSYFEFCTLRTLSRKAEPKVCVEVSFYLEQIYGHLNFWVLVFSLLDLEFFLLLSISNCDEQRGQVD